MSDLSLMLAPYAGTVPYAGTAVEAGRVSVPRRSSERRRGRDALPLSVQLVGG
jgi:hypothetical protein